MNSTGETRTITSAAIGPYPQGLADLTMPMVTVTYNDGTTEKLFSFYPDELSFTSEEFVGLTRQQALNLRRRKDTEYLQR